MLEFINYQFIPPGKVSLQSRPSSKTEEIVQLPLLSASSSRAGEFEVKAVGTPMPQIGETVKLPIKGAKQLCLELPVIEAQALINPPQAWQVICDGPKISEFEIREANVQCDQCQVSILLEFVVFSSNTTQDALGAMRKNGWLADVTCQICPACASRIA